VVLSSLSLQKWDDYIIKMEYIVIPLLFWKQKLNNRHELCLSLNLAVSDLSLFLSSQMKSNEKYKYTI